MGGPGSGSRKGKSLTYPRATARPKLVSHAVVDCGKSRRELSKLAGVSPGRGSDILAGRISCKLAIAEKYAALLEQPVRILFTVEDAPPASESSMAPAVPVRRSDRSRKPKDVTPAPSSTSSDPKQQQLPLERATGT